MPYKYRQLDSHASATSKTSKKPKAVGDDGPYPYEPSKAEIIAAKAEQKRITRMQNDYLNQGSGRVTTGKVTNKYAEGVKNPGRAQPKGTPPRTGPGSGAGGQSARYSRLTGGLMKHGR